MTSNTKTNIFAFAQSRGFVVAMRAKLINAPHPPRFEWVIVSRWGPQGDHLSIGWTALPAAAGEAPIHLTPRQTSLALRPHAALPDATAAFQLAPSLPDQITIAGHFIPAEGQVRLYGSFERLRVVLKGRCLACDPHSEWTVEATRVAWIGEFIEAPKACGPC